VAEFTFKDYGAQLRKEAGLVEEAVKVIRRTVKLHGPRLVQAEISELTRPPVDRGTYRRNFKFEDIPHGAVAYNFTPYAPIIEYGRRRGQKAPPIAAIAAWIRRKGIGEQRGPVGSRVATRGPGSVKVLGGRGQLARQGPAQRVTVARRHRLNERQVMNLAYVIARQIKRRGLPALLILQHASGNIDAEIQKAIAAMMEKRTTA